MKIGVILVRYPEVSETFIQTFLSHLEAHEVVLLSNLNQGARLKKGWSARPYLNLRPSWRDIPGYLGVLLSILFKFNRFLKLRRKGVRVRQILADASIWTTDGLDVLHYPFGNYIISRELYTEVMGCKASVSYRGSDINVYPVFHKMSYAPIWPYVQKVQANAMELREKLIALHQLPSSVPAIVIHPALRAAFQLTNEQIDSICQQRSYQQEQFLTIGRLHWIKDYPVIFYALALLKKKGLDFQYTIVGGGPAREHLYFLASELGIAENIRWKGSMRSEEIILMMQSCTLYVQSSLAEGFSNSCIEAQSQGLLCVVTDVSGMADCIEDGVTGAIVPGRRAEDFAAGIERMISQPETKRREDAVYAAKRVRDTFTVEAQRKQWLEFFETM